FRSRAGRNARRRVLDCRGEAARHATALDRPGRADDGVGKGRRFRAAGRIVRREGSVLYKRQRTAAGHVAGNRAAGRSRGGRADLGVPIEYASADALRADIAARFGGVPALEGIATLSFAKPVSAKHWLQASNPSERWKWDFMYQDLPPVKGELDPTALPLPPG